MNLYTWLVDDHILCFKTDSGETIIPSAEEIYRIVHGGVSEFRDVVLLVKPQDAIPEITFSRYPLDLFLEINTSPESGDFLIEVNAVAEYLEVRTTVNSHIEKKLDHILINSVWYPFARGALEAISAELLNVGITSPGTITPRQYLDLLSRKNISSLIIRDMTEKQSDALNVSNLIEKRIPGPFFRGTLYPYQEQGYRWLSWITGQDTGCILADEMGLGKTIQFIALLTEKRNIGYTSLVIAPATLLINWKREIDRFAPDLQVIIHRGSERTGFPSELEGLDVVITSYETAVRDLYILRMVPWNIIALDEAQAIKNPHAQRTIAVKKITCRTGVAITGTPVQNNLVDLWSITDFALPGLLGSLDTFLQDYETTETSARLLEPVVSPIMLRRTVNEVAKDLPERIDIPQYLELCPQSAQNYEDLRQQILSKFGGGAAFVMLMKLRMFCAHPFLLNDTEMDPARASEKYTHLMEILEEIFIYGNKALIFTSFRKMADILVQDLRQRFGVYSRNIDGRVAIPERQEIIDEFGIYNGSGVLVLNPRAAGTGLNITAASHVIHYNPEWNPAVEDQATARAHRIGQTRPVTVHRLIYTETVEEAMDERLTRKRKLAESAVVGVEGKEEEYNDIFNAIRKSPITKVVEE